MTGLLIAVIFCAEELYRNTAFLTAGEPISGKYRWYILLLIGFWKVISVMFAGSLAAVVKINSATILYAYNTGFFVKQIMKNCYDQADSLTEKQIAGNGSKKIKVAIGMKKCQTVPLVPMFPCGKSVNSVEHECSDDVFHNALPLCAAVSAL